MMSLGALFFKDARLTAKRGDTQRHFTRADEYFFVIVGRASQLVEHHNDGTRTGSCSARNDFSRLPTRF